MENILLDDEIEYKTINNIKALVSKVNYPSKIKDQPQYKKWLEYQKKKEETKDMFLIVKIVIYFFILLMKKKKDKEKIIPVITIILEKYVIIVEKYILTIHIVV